MSLTSAMPRLRPLAARLPSVPRWLRIALIAVAALYAAYLVAANVILRTHLLRGWVNDGATDVRLMEYSSAWTIWPGRVHVNDFSLRFQDENVQFLLTVDHAVTDIDLLALTKRTFRSTKTVASGVSYFIRMKTEDAKGKEVRIAAYPPISGFENTLIRPEHESVPVSDEQYDSFIIEMHDITATVKELWALEYHYRGEASVAGSFHLKPMRDMWLTPSVLLGDGGTLSIGNREFVRNAHMKVEVRIDPFDVRGPSGLEIFRQIDARLHVEGEATSLAPFGDAYLSPKRDIHFEGGAGSVVADARLDHALLINGETKVDYQTKSARVMTPYGTFAGDLHFTSKVDGERENGVLVGEVAIEHAAFAPKDQAVDAHDVNIGIRLDHADVSKEFTMSSLTGRVGKATANLPRLNSLLPKDVAFDSGAATFSGRFGYHGGALDGRGDTTIEKAKIKAGPAEILATGKAWLAVKSADIHRLITFPELGADLSSAGIHLDGQAADDLWVKIGLAGTAMRPESAETTIKVAAGPGDRILRFGAGAVGIPKEAADITSGQQLDATLKLKKTKTDTALSIVDARDGKLEAKGRLAKSEGSKLRGAFLFELGPLTAGVLVDQGKASVRPFVSKEWLDQN